MAEKSERVCVTEICVNSISITIISCNLQTFCIKGEKWNMKENLASGPTLWRNKVTAFCWIKMPPLVRGSDSAAAPTLKRVANLNTWALAVWKRGSNPHCSGCHHQSGSLSDAPVGKGVGHLSRALAPLHACLRIFGRLMLEHESPGDVLFTSF